MKAITIRFGDSTFETIKTEAASEAQSISSFIREAALMRAVALGAQRGNTDWPPELLEAVCGFLESEDLRRQPRSS